MNFQKGELFSGSPGRPFAMMGFSLRNLVQFRIESSKVLKISRIFEDLNNLHDILEIPKKILNVLKKDQRNIQQTPDFSCDK